MSIVLVGSTSGSITLQEPAVAGTNTVNLGANTGVAILDANSPGFRNRLINGGMVLDQRNGGASVTITNTGASTYTLDRWKADVSQASKISVQQNVGAVTSPAGFTNYLGVTSLSAYTVGASEVFAITQIIEGYNISDLGWGAAGASPVTLSFWVRSSLTGTFGIVLENSANNRSYPATYTISAANTWEKKSITVAGDTTGAWVTNSGKGVQVKFGLGVGSTYSGTAGAWAAADYWGATGATSLVGTNGATFYITGVQFEKGSTATAFDDRDYGTELFLAQRYFTSSTGASYLPALCFSTNRVLSGAAYSAPTMRTVPTVTASATGFTFFLAGAAYTSTVVGASAYISGYVVLDVTVAATAGASGVGVLTPFSLSAEL